MKKVFLICALALLLACGSTAAVAKGNPVDQLTGKVWMDSEENVKLAFIYGVECAITIEYFVADKLKEQQKKPVAKAEPRSTLSPFEKGWTEAFKDRSRESIVLELDNWYKAHADQLDKPVFAVLWNEMIAPKLKTR